MLDRISTAHDWWKLAVVEDNSQTALEAIKAQYDDAIKRINASKYEDASKSCSAATNSPRACSRWSRSSSR
jgi:hypothetical protein